MAIHAMMTPIILMFSNRVGGGYDGDKQGGGSDGGKQGGGSDGGEYGGGMRGNCIICFQL